MNLRAACSAFAGVALLAPVVIAAPSVSAPIEIAPRLFVPSYYTSEPVQAIAAGGGSVAVLTSGGRLTLLSEDLAFIGEPLGWTFAASNVVYDGNDFLLATFAAQPANPPNNYLAALELQRLAPDGTLTDDAIVLGDVHESGTFDADVAMGCRAPGDCLVAYSMRLYGTGGTSDKDIWVAPVNDGVPGSSIHVTTAANDQIAPSVVWNGTDWVVTWVDLRFATGDSWGYKGTQIYGARVNTAGVVLDPIGVALASYAEVIDGSNVSSYQPLPDGLALARSGSTTLLAWRGASSSRIVGRRIGSDLSLVDSTPTVMASPGSSWVDAPVLLPTSSGFTAVIGESGSGLGYTNVDVLDLGLDGVPTGAPTEAGTRFANHAVAARLSDDTVVLGKTVRGPNNNSIGDPYTDTWVERVDGSGTELGAVYASESVTVVDGRALAQTPGIGVAVYADNRTGDNGQYPDRLVYAAVLAAGNVLPAAGLQLAAGYRNVVAAAAGANRALVVWDEGASGARNVAGALLGPAGTVQLNLTFGGQSYDESTPKVAFDGTSFVVSWVDRGNGYDAGVFRRVAPSGSFVDPAFVFLEPGLTSSTVIDDLECNDNGGCLARSGSKYYLIENGAVTAQKSSSEVGLNVFEAPRIAAGASGFALMTLGQSFADVALIRLGADLTVNDDPPVDLFDANYVSTLVPKSKVVGWNGTRYAAAWGNSQGISLASLAETGSPSEPFFLTQVGGVPGPHSTIGNEQTRNLLVAGESGRTVVGYQDRGRLLVRSITDLEDTGGTGGSAGTGGSDAGTQDASPDGAAGTGGDAGAPDADTDGGGGVGGSAGVGGTGGSGGTAGSGGSGAAAGSGGSGGAGVAGQAGTAGTGGQLPDAGVSGAAGEPATPAPNASSSDDGGCGCGTVGTTSERANWGWLGLVVGLGLLARRRP